MKQTTLNLWTNSNQQKLNQETTDLSNEVINLCSDDDDVILVTAMEESLKTYHLEESNKLTSIQPSTSLQMQTSSLNNDAMVESSSSTLKQSSTLFKYIPTSNDSEFLDDFSMEEGKSWVYSNNYPLRDYQFNIAEQTLYRNTLVCLPTGLGKTFIAAVVMFNFYRWYPHRKIVFMAPTRPLVAQQMEACYKVTGIPEDDTVEMTGSLSPIVRQKLWNEKRVFFLTPQVIVNDLVNKACQSKSICCLVLDEAHKATGNYAYCQVIRELTSQGNRQFRVMALTATPGGDIPTVQDIINNLLIAHIELRTDECPDIQKYSYSRNIEKVVVQLTPELNDVKERLIGMQQAVVCRLKTRRALLPRFNVYNLSKFMLIKQKEDFMKGYGSATSHVEMGFIQRDFSVGITLYHAFDLLLQHGLRPLFTFFDGILKGEKGSFVSKTELEKMNDFHYLWNLLETRYRGSLTNDNDMFSTQTTFVSGHPKVDKMKEILLSHFNNYKREYGDSATKVIIFTNFRDSVNEIMHMLKQMRPLIRPICFVGQSSGKSNKGYSQKEQLRVMKEFRDNVYNTLVSTCVGEEGLDIGEVDLIICFDSQKSPVRMIQRMGRTGRKRAGKIVVLLTEGKEERNYSTSLSKKKTINDAIFSGFRRLNFYPDNPRMIPISINPVPNVKPIEIKMRKDNSLKRQSTILTMIGPKIKTKNATELRLNDDMRYLEPTIDINLLVYEPIVASRLNSLPASNDTVSLQEGILLTDKYHLNSYLKEVSSGLQEVGEIEHSGLCHNIISVLKVIQEHKRGRTSIVFHALGLRSLDLETSLSQSDNYSPKSRRKKQFIDEFSSDDDFDVPKSHMWNDSVTYKIEEKVDENMEFPSSPVFGITQVSPCSNDANNDRVPNVFHQLPNWVSVTDNQLCIIGGISKIQKPPSEDDIHLLATTIIKDTSIDYNLIDSFWNDIQKQIDIVKFHNDDDEDSDIFNYDVGFTLPQSCDMPGFSKCSTDMEDISVEDVPLSDFLKLNFDERKPIKSHSETSKEVAVLKNQLTSTPKTLPSATIMNSPDRKDGLNVGNSLFKIPVSPLYLKPLSSAPLSILKVHHDNDVSINQSVLSCSTQLSYTQACNFLDETSLHVETGWLFDDSKLPLVSVSNKVNQLVNSGQISNYGLLKSDINEELGSPTNNLFEMTLKLDSELLDVVKSSDIHTSFQREPSPCVTNARKENYPLNLSTSQQIIPQQTNQDNANKCSTSNSLSNLRTSVCFSETQNFQFGDKSNDDFLNDINFSPPEYANSNRPLSNKRAHTTSTSNLLSPFPKIYKIDENIENASELFDISRNVKPRHDESESSKQDFIVRLNCINKDSTQSLCHISENIDASQLFESSRSVNPREKIMNQSSNYLQDMQQLEAPARLKKMSKKKIVSKNYFLSQAVVSSADENNENDESDASDNDRYELSFVDDSNCNSDTSKMKSVYLQSIKSPPIKKPLLKMLPPINNPSFIYSQFTQRNDDEYMLDSFCVRSSEEESPSRLLKKRKTKKKSKEGNVRKRLICCDTSSSNNNESDVDDFL